MSLEGRKQIVLDTKYRNPLQIVYLHKLLGHTPSDKESTDWVNGDHAREVSDIIDAAENADIRALAEAEDYHAAPEKLSEIVFARHTA